MVSRLRRVMGFKPVPAVSHLRHVMLHTYVKMPIIIDGFAVDCSILRWPVVRRTMYIWNMSLAALRRRYVCLSCSK